MEKKEKRIGLNGAELKWIAIILMAADHIAVALIAPKIVSTGALYTCYTILRYLGRFSFPMFCFLMIEGFVHTRSRKKYLRNLILFALISEIPFDLALFGSVWEPSHQNVFFTLAIGMAAIWCADGIQSMSVQNGLHIQTAKVMSLTTVFIAAMIAMALATDYGAVGVCVIFFLYELRHRRVVSAIVAWIILICSNITEIYAFPFIIATALYNGKRGKQHKYFFYVFYPLHLIILYGIRVLIQ